MKQLKRQSLFGSIINMKCPKCREGKLFNTTTFSFQKPFEMNRRCEVCTQTFMPEPGFYFGAMYVAYAITGGISLVLSTFLLLVVELSLIATFAATFFILAIFYVWFFRIARSIWIHTRVKYTKD